MASKIGVSIVLAAALFGASVQLPAASCVFSSTPSAKACKAGCCLNRTCCETSRKNTGSPLQPFAKSGSGQGNVATLPAMVAVAVLDKATVEPIFASAKVALHSLAPLALICIRLI
jgi:hypothetical protein